MVKKAWPSRFGPPPPPESTARAFRFLKELADDMSRGDVSFPTFIDATMRVRVALNNPEITAEKLARIVSSEPLLPTKLLGIANSVAANPSGKQVSDVKSAVMRVGFSAVRAVAVAVAMEQLKASQAVQGYRVRAEAVWRHSLDVAALAYVIAKKMTKISPDEALFAGLVHDIGVFYLLSRAGMYPELTIHQDELDSVLNEWHPSIGEAVLQAFNLTEATLHAVESHERGEYNMPPETLADVVTIANLAARCPNPLNRDVHSEVPSEPCLMEEPDLFVMLDESAEDLLTLRDALRQ